MENPDPTMRAVYLQVFIRKMADEEKLKEVNT
jgi:hypothetical protein